jgi:hypothetical protein
LDSLNRTSGILNLAFDWELWLDTLATGRIASEIVMWFQNIWGIPTTLTVAIRRVFKQGGYDKCLELRPIKAGSLRQQYADAIKEFIRDDLQKFKEGIPQFYHGIEATDTQFRRRNLNEGIFHFGC